MKLSFYHRCVVGVYILMVLAVTVFFPRTLNYNLELVSAETLPLVISAAALLICMWTYRTRALKGLVYGLVFAVPEEIFFRGLIQVYLYTLLDATAAAVVGASLVFGLAHLPNRAYAWHPRGWNWRFAALAFLAGLPLGLLFAVTDSLLTPTVVHATLVCILYSAGVQLGKRS